MKNFYYTAKNKNNETLHNYIMAESIADAATTLEQMGYTVLDIKEEEDFSGYNSDYSSYNYAKVQEFTVQEKKEFFNAFYHLYNSGVPVVETFRSISISTTNPNIKAFCQRIIKKTEKGYTLRETLKNYTSCLGIAYTMLIAAGEESGKLEETLEGVLKNIKKQEEIKSNLISSLAYPVLIFCLALAVGLLFKFFIMKVFSSMADGGLCSKAIMFLLITAIIKIAIIFAILITGTVIAIKNRKVSARIRNFFANIKLIGNILKNYYYANFFSVLALSYEAGIPLSESLFLSNSVVNISSCRPKLKKAANMVQNGCSISTALSTTNLFSGYAMSQISAGEQAGELDKMLKAVAFDYENKLDTAIKVMLKLVEPVMICLIGIFAGYIVITAYKSYYNGIMSMF